jgi:hypothetical protein
MSLHPRNAQGILIKIDQLIVDPHRWIIFSGGGGSELNSQTAMYPITGGLSAGIIFAFSA